MCVAQKLTDNCFIFLTFYKGLAKKCLIAYVLLGFYCKLKSYGKKHNMKRKML